jgi:multidrug efflux system outer membrane protein
MIKRFALLFSACAMAACNLAPSYVRPPAPVPAQWTDAAGAKGERRATELDWREYFPDPRLSALILAALDNNRDMRIATARVAEARALYGIQRADRLPTVNLAADRSAARTPADLSMVGRAVTTQRYDVDLGLLSFELDFWGRVKNLSDAALASYLATDEARRSFRLSLIADVADTYFGVQEMEERVAIARRTMQGRQEMRDLIARRREVGVAGDLDFYQADAILETAKVDLASLERQYANAENALSLLVGQLPEQMPAARKLTEQGIVAKLSADLPSEVLLARPDVLAAEQGLIAANANIGVARAAFLPRINLTGSFGTASTALGSLFKPGQQAWTFQPTLSEPLFDAGRTSSSVDLAEARKVIAVAQYEKTVQQAFREVTDLLVARQKLVEQLKAQEAVERAQTERLRLTDARYQGGVANHLELLDAQRDAFTAQQGSVQVRRQVLSAAAQLYKALGGGDAHSAESARN